MPPGEVQIAWPGEQAATQSKMAPVVLAIWMRYTNSKICSHQNRALLVGLGPLHNARNLSGARACPEGVSGTPPLFERNESTQDDRGDEQELAR